MERKLIRFSVKSLQFAVTVLTSGGFASAHFNVTLRIETSKWSNESYLMMSINQEFEVMYDLKLGFLNKLEFFFTYFVVIIKIVILYMYASE